MSFKVTTRAGRRVYKGAPPKRLARGACPHCYRVIQLTVAKRRRWHIDPATGTTCTGAGIHVGETPVDLDDLPDVALPADVSVDHRTLQHRAVVTVDGEIVRYRGSSDREPAHGRAECPSCLRHIPLNSDGLTIRRHRVRHQDPFAPYCT